MLRVLPIFGAALGAAALLVTRWPSDRTQPVLVLDPPRIEFVDQTGASTVELSYKLRNTSPNAIEPVLRGSSCSCLSVKFAPPQVPPNGESIARIGIPLGESSTLGYFLISAGNDMSSIVRGEFEIRPRLHSYLIVSPGRVLLTRKARSVTRQVALIAVLGPQASPPATVEVRGSPGLSAEVTGSWIPLETPGRFERPMVITAVHPGVLSEDPQELRIGAPGWCPEVSVLRVEWQ